MTATFDRGKLVLVSRPFRFAVQALGLSDHDTVAASARQAEDLGYEEFYSYDHLAPRTPSSP